MSNYVISDIHGCFDEFQTMLDKISLSNSDRLFLAGDYIDRGNKSLEMLNWLERKPDNVVLIKGNHDEEFAEYVHLMEQTDKKNELMTDPESNEDTQILLDSVRYMFKKKSPLGLLYFDYYNTITDFVMNKGVTFGELTKWADMLQSLPYYESLNINGRQIVIVHAGYCEDEIQISGEYKGKSDFYLYARDDAIELGGISKGTIIAGHTPTIEEDSRFFNDGEVFCYHDKEKDCFFYDIDCGCSFYETSPSATLACIRIDDGEIYYL